MQAKALHVTPLAADFTKGDAAILTRTGLSSDLQPPHEAAVVTSSRSVAVMIMESAQTGTLSLVNEQATHLPETLHAKKEIRARQYTGTKPGSLLLCLVRDFLSAHRQVG